MRRPRQGNARRITVAPCASAGVLFHLLKARFSWRHLAVLHILSAATLHGFGKMLVDKKILLAEQPPWTERLVFVDHCDDWTAVMKLTECEQVFLDQIRKDDDKVIVCCQLTESPVAVEHGSVIEGILRRTFS